MIFDADAETIMGALSMATRMADDDRWMLEHVAVHADADASTVRVLATDSFVAVRATVPAQVTESGSALLHRTVIDLVEAVPNRQPTDTVEIQRGDDGSVMVQYRGLGQIVTWEADNQPHVDGWPNVDDLFDKARDATPASDGRAHFNPALLARFGRAFLWGTDAALPVELKLGADERAPVYATSRDGTVEAMIMPVMLR